MSEGTGTVAIGGCVDGDEDFCAVSGGGGAGEPTPRPATDAESLDMEMAALVIGVATTDEPAIDGTRTGPTQRVEEMASAEALVCRTGAEAGVGPCDE